MIKAGFFESDLADMMTQALGSGAQVISPSFGTYSFDDQELPGIPAPRRQLDAHAATVTGVGKVLRP